MNGLNPITVAYTERWQADAALSRAWARRQGRLLASGGAGGRELRECERMAKRWARAAMLAAGRISARSDMGMADDAGNTVDGRRLAVRAGRVS